MQQHLELERLLALVADVQHSLQTILAQSHSVDEAELVGPGLLVLSGEVGRAKTEVELDRIVAALGQSARFRRGAAQVLPGGVASEAVLRKGASSVVFRGRAECLYMYQYYCVCPSNLAHAMLLVDLRGRRSERRL